MMSLKPHRVSSCTLSFLVYFTVSSQRKILSSYEDIKEFLMDSQVLYMFLEFFSNFDWDRYCVSLWGPVPLASVPVVAGRQSISGEKLQELGKLVKFFRMEHKCVFFPLALRKGIILLCTSLTSLSFQIILR
jgi:hypothetical protein